MLEFKFADTLRIEQLLPDLFKILHSNMSPIAPTSNSFNEDFEIWSSCIIPAMQIEQRQMVLMCIDDILAGYFEYYISADKSLLIMEDIQIKKAFQGTGLFSEFYKWLIKQLPNDIKNVKAYANKKNFKSQSVLEHLGLLNIGENKNGNSFCYSGKYVDLMNKYS